MVDSHSSWQAEDERMVPVDSFVCNSFIVCASSALSIHFHSTAGSWPALVTSRLLLSGGAIPAGLNDPAGQSRRVAVVAAHVECPRDGSDGLDRGPAHSRQALAEGSAEGASERSRPQALGFGSADRQTSRGWWIPAQLIKRPNVGMLLTKVDQKTANHGTVLTGGGRREGCSEGINHSLELAY